MDYNEDPFYNHPVQHKNFFADTNMSGNFQQQQQQPPQQQESSPSIYLMKAKPPQDAVTGSMNLLVKHGLESTHNKFCVKKLKESLSSYLSSVPSVMDDPGNSIGSSLTMLIKEPPITANAIRPLETSSLMAAFRLHPGRVPERYLPEINKVESKKRHKHKSKNRLDSLSPDVKMMEMKEAKKPNKRKHEPDEKKKKKKEKKRRKEKERS